MADVPDPAEQLRSGDRPDPVVVDRPAGPWALLLLVPLVCLVTPLFNRDGPRVIGLPVFYWAQFLAVPLGVLCTIVVLRRTSPASWGPRRSSR